MSHHKRNAISAALTVVGASAALPAAADTVYLSDTISLDQALSGSNTSVQFNIGSLLTSQGFDSGDVISGTLVVYGLSDPSYDSATAQPYSDYQVTDTSTRTASYYSPGYYSPGYYSPGYYSCSSWGGCYYSPGYYSPGYYSPGYSYYYSVTDTTMTRTRDILHEDNVADVMQVTAGGAIASDTANQTSSSADPYAPGILDSTTGSDSTGYTYYYSQERDTYDAIFGALEVTMDLDLLALEDIWTDGILNFDVSATTGQFQLLNAELIITAENIAPVPVPGSLGLFGAGLATLVARRRRRTENKG